MIKHIAIAAGTMLAVGGLAAQATAAVSVTIEAPGVQNTTATFDYSGVENFDGRTLGTGQNFPSNFGGSPISGVYQNATIETADQYGGAGHTGQYVVAGLQSSPSSYTIDFSGSANPVNYFGFWLSALDKGNSVQFYDGATNVFSFTPDNVLAFVGADGSNYLGGAYYGNPVTHENGAEPYVFVNFFFEDGLTFDKIVFQQTAANPGAGYESDNHTVGWYNDHSGDPVPGVPEPATWLMMIGGFGLIGLAMRRRTRVSVTYA